MRWIRKADEDSQPVYKPIFFINAEDVGKQEQWEALSYAVQRHICRWPQARRDVYGQDLARMARIAQEEIAWGIRP